jgi:hypothetical protein
VFLIVLVIEQVDELRSTIRCAYLSISSGSYAWIWLRRPPIVDEVQAADCKLGVGYGVEESVVLKSGGLNEGLY